MKFYTGDLHFGHPGVLDFDNRPFKSLDEMEDVMIRNWNARVEKNDHVYILGDFAYRNEKPFSHYLKQLNGNKHLIIGNHDGRLLKDSEAMSYFIEAYRYCEITDEQKHIILSHFPIAEWNGYYRQAYHIHGHIHGRTDVTYHFMKQFDRVLNAGCMINNFMPVTFNELIINNQRFKELNP